MQTINVFSFESPLGVPVEIVRQTFSAASSRFRQRVSVVAGLHGDELEGVYICGHLSRILQDLKKNKPHAFLGEVHIYPAMNPQALGNHSRLWPYFSIDMNRTMGDRERPGLPFKASQEILSDIQKHSDLAVDIHASNQYLLELPQIRIIDGFQEPLVPLAELCNIDLIWVHPMAEVFKSTLGYNLNSTDIPTLVIETGICHRIHTEYCQQVLTGLLNLLVRTGVLDSQAVDLNPVKTPILVNPTEVGMVQAKTSGLFVPQAQIGIQVNKGDPLGQMLDPKDGKILEEVSFPFDGFLFTLRQHPLCYEGAPLARVALGKTRVL